MRERQLREPGQPSESVEHLDLVVPSTEGTHDIPVRLHCEKDVAALRPCLLSIHGGYVIGSHLGDDGNASTNGPPTWNASASPSATGSPRRFRPGPLEDCYSTLRWIYDHGPELGVDPQRIGVLGGSAGGGLAAGLALLARDRGEVPLLLQALNYPMLDDQLDTRSNGRLLERRWGLREQPVRLGRADLANFPIDEPVPAYAVPSRAPDLSGLPQAFVAVGNLDGLLDEDIDYAHRLILAGVPTDLHVYADGPHAFDSMLPDTAVAQRASRVFEDWLRDRLRPRIA